MDSGCATPSRVPISAIYWSFVGHYCLDQYRRNPNQRDDHANNSRCRWYFAQQENTQNYTSSHFLRGDQVGIGGVDAAHRSVVEGVSQAEREDTQGDDRADCAQWVGV